MNFRESHRGTLLGMTRFRDVLDDMPILGYGASALRHDRLYSFHNTLAGHSLGYISRGTCVVVGRSGRPLRATSLCVALRCGHNSHTALPTTSCGFGLATLLVGARSG